MNLWSILLAIITGNFIFGIITLVFIGLVFECYNIIMLYVGIGLYKNDPEKLDELNDTLDMVLDTLREEF